MNLTGGILMDKVDVKQIKPAKSYTNALYETAKEMNSSEKVLKELEYIVEIIDKNSELKTFFFNPVVTKDDKKEVLRKVFEGIISSNSMNFLLLLADNGRFDLIETILSEYTKKVDKELNIEKPCVISAIELSEEYKQKITQKLESKLNATVIPSYRVEPEIIGGLIIEARDKTIDFSLRTKFKNMTKELTKG